MLTDIFKVGGHHSVLYVSASTQNTLTMRLAGRMARMGKKEGKCMQVFAAKNWRNTLNSEPRYGGLVLV